VPWRTIDEFEQARDLLEDWKRSQRRVLKTKQDYDDMIAWGAARRSRRKTGTRGHNSLSPVASAALKLLAHRTAGIASVLESPVYDLDDDAGDTQTTSKWSPQHSDAPWGRPGRVLRRWLEANLGTLEQTPPETSGCSQRK
jgi:hypothetical protein